MLKKTVIALYVAVVVAMATATMVEHAAGTTFYQSWWFTMLWAMLAAAGGAYIIKVRARKRATFWMIHVALLAILAGAMLTHLTSRDGVIHLREGEETDIYQRLEGDEVKSFRLPFRLRLDRFDVSYHDGTRAAADYATRFTIIDGDKRLEQQVSMNHIASYKTYRLIQNSYDSDGRGSLLSVNSDPYGIATTYVGYALFFIALVWMLIDPKGTFRRLLRKVAVVALIATPLAAGAATTVPRPVADAFGRLYIDYNDRICPVQTFAIDFTKKLHGSASYDGLTAEQVLLSYIFFANEWDNEPMVKVKSSELRSLMGIEKQARISDFFSPEGYRLGGLLEGYANGERDALHKAAADIDDRLQLVMALRQGTLLRIFPRQSEAHAKQTIQWFSPAERPTGDDSLLVRSFFPMLYEYIQAGKTDSAEVIISQLARYQQKRAGASLPTPTQVRAERMLNAIPFATVLFMLNLTMAVICFALFMRKRPRGFWAAYAVMVCSFTALTLALALRWTVSGTVPMSNGYETMLIMAWFVQLIALLFSRRVRLLLMFGFLLSGFFLLVSHINAMNPNISHIMPVLNSPLLSLHVSVIMMSYALLSLTFVCGVMGICFPRLRDQLHVLSRLFLYPALTTLGIGIFVGAIWANVSWGTYWSWDPKETWALITLMVYAVVVHTESLPLFRRPLPYFVYTTLAFLTLLMTYFGVNYLLGGMHSYA